MAAERSEQTAAPRGVNEKGEVICSDCLALEGELAETKALLAAKAAELTGAERDLNTWRRRYADLAADKDAEAREHEHFDSIADLFALWNRAKAEAEGRDKPGRSKFTTARFWLALPFYKQHGEELCQRAIIGRCYDHYGHDGSVRRKNGSAIHYLEWERIFEAEKRYTGAFEESCNRAPSDWRERVARLSA